MPARVLTWNLKHGRAVPSAGRDLFDDFAAALARWSWDVALLQEVPPWWPPRLGARLGTEWRVVLTSRNLGLPVRRALAVRWPDAIKSNGGGCNAILVRRAAGLSIASRRVLRLTWLPERRWLIGVALGGPGSDTPLWVGNVHLTGGLGLGRGLGLGLGRARGGAVARGRGRGRAGAGGRGRGGGGGGAGVAAAREAAAAADAITRWAVGGPVVLGGDFNLRTVSLPGFEPAASFDVDHLLVRGLDVLGEAVVLDRGSLSDHAPIAVTVAGW